MDAANVGHFRLALHERKVDSIDGLKGLGDEALAEAGLGPAQVTKLKRALAKYRPKADVDPEAESK